MPDAPETESLVDTPEGPQLRIRQLRAEIIAGPDSGRMVKRPGPAVRVGTLRDCDVVLHDPAVSGHHLTLHIERGGVRVVDAGSRNGTYVDGLRVRDGDARPDSTIALGHTRLRLGLVEDYVHIALSAKPRFGGLLGESPAMRRVFAILEKVASTDAPVLLEAETGTGKELAAEAIHGASRRAGEPFAVFDCSAVNAQLIESELFGHRRGAFTGAIADRIGAFEEAHGGTLFLDEIGELPLELQPRLLRALDNHQVRRVGDNASRDIDVRIVAATNRNLAAEVDRGRFREDLYYRLAVVRVALPPLRERAEDLPALVAHFTEQFAHRRNPAAPVTPLSEDTVRELATRTWRGNVRELRNAVFRMLSLGEPAADPPAPTPPAAPAVSDVDLDVPLRDARDAVLERFEIAYITAALAASGGHIGDAARRAGVHRKFFQRAMARYHLRGRE
ncbi:MAG: FHA domain-containing protein [Deltaproteobacteria bacterium]|nr:MAG: FHA domain-containing protein [Deltaproteobacteria bacterium]TMQ11440.1 MAG: FHA domain-containing protein [Deltaproteobacteria bacterium]